jgi:uncharacterized small protein (DUF1192 family)
MVKMDPATIGLLISIAPTVLDLLFGRGHIKESFRQQRYPLENMCGYGLEGYGYRYPKRRRKLTVQTFYSPEVQPDVIRAATFNRSIAKKNPWIQHLEKSHFYDKVRKLLQKARANYKPKDPEKRAKVLARELTKLQAQLNILEKEKAAKSLEIEYNKRYGEKFKDLPYETVLNDKIARLQNEIARIQQSLPTGQLQLLAPK